MSKSAYLHPLKKCVINLYKGSNGFLAWKINLEMLKQSSKDHPVREISIQNQEVFEKHKISDEFRYIDSNAFQKAIDQEWSTTPGITILSQFWEKIIKTNHGKDLGESV